MEELDLIKYKIKNLVDDEDYKKYIRYDTDIVRGRRVLREMSKWAKMNDREKQKEIVKITKDFDKINNTNYYKKTRLPYE
jgi:hypothetical protein